MFEENIYYREQLLNDSHSDQFNNFHGLLNMSHDCDKDNRIPKIQFTISPREFCLKIFSKISTTSLAKMAGSVIIKEESVITIKVEIK